MPVVTYKNKLFLNETFKDDNKDVILSEDKTSIIIPSKNKDPDSSFRMSPFCFTCNRHDFVSETEDNKEELLIYVCSKMAHIYCEFCMMFILNGCNNQCISGDGGVVTNIKSLKNEFMENIDITQSICDNLMYICKWPNCGKIYWGSNLGYHELLCEYQPKIKCPVIECTWKGRRSSIIKEHLLHYNQKIVLDNTFDKPSPGTTYHFLFGDVFIALKYSMKTIGDAYCHYLHAIDSLDNKTNVLITVTNTKLKFVNTIKNSGEILSHSSDIVVAVSVDDKKESFLMHL